MKIYFDKNNKELHDYVINIIILLMIIFVDDTTLFATNISGIRNHLTQQLLTLFKDVFKHLLVQYVQIIVIM